MRWKAVRYRTFPKATIIGAVLSCALPLLLIDLHARTPLLPDCAVTLHVTEPGKPVPGQGVPVHPSDSVVVLGQDQIVELELTLANRGSTESFDVSFESLGATQVTTGGGKRQATARTGEFGALSFSVKGLDAGASCSQRSRGLRVVARTGSGEAEKVCGVSETYFECASP